MNKGRVIGWGIVILLLLGIGGFFGIRSMVRANKVKPFNEHLTAYLESAKAPAALPKAGLMPIGGKLITVDLESREIDYLYFDLPDELRAETPAEVTDVVQLKWDKRQMGHYGPNQPAYRQTCEMMVKDSKTGALLHHMMYEGSDPPKSVKSSASQGMGNKPTDKIVDYLKSLPRK